MFCTACGQKLPDGAKFCTKCGAPVAKIEPRVAPDAAPARDAGAQEAALSQETEPVQKVAPAQEAVPAQAAPDASQQAADEAKKAAQPEAAGEETPAAVPADAPVEAMETRVMPGAADATTVMAPDAAEVTSAPAEDDEPAVAPSDTDATTVVASDTGETRVMPEGSDETTVMPGNAETTVLPAADAAVTAEAERAEAAADAAAAEQALWSAPDAAADAGTGATTVLQPGHMADAPVGEVSAQDAQPPRKKRPVALIATIVLIVVAAGAFFAIFVLPRMMGKDVPTASYGQSDPLQCSVVTRVRPRDASGEDLTSYVVRLMRRASDDASKSGTASDAFNEVVAEIRVTGNNGFTMDNFGDIPDGDYMLVIAPDGSGGGSKGSSSRRLEGNGSGSGSSDASDEQRIPIHYEEDNPKAEEEVVVEPPAPETDSAQEPAEENGLTDEQIAAALYYYTCQDLIEEYGAPATADRNSGGEVAASGLALADLIDFDGDGTDELLTVVCTKDPATTTSFYGDDTYQVAVWRYADGAVEQVYEGDVSHSNGGYYYVNLYEREADAADDPAQTVIEVYSYPAPTEPETEVTRSEYYGLGDDGFEAVASCQIESSYVDHDTTTTVAIDGAEASEDDWKDFVSSLEQVANYEFNLPASDVEAQSESDAEPATKIDTVLPDALSERTQDTIDALEEAAGFEALEAYAPDEEETDDADTEADASYAVTSNEADVTFMTSQGNGDDWEESRTWTYPEFVLSPDCTTDEALDKLNASFKESFEADLAATQGWSFDSGETQIWVHRDDVTYLQGSVACVRSSRELFNGGAHGSEAMSGAFYDLSTGEEISIEEALGVPWDELQGEAVDAISAYIEANPNTYGANADSIEGMAADATRYFATPDGIAIAIMPYEIAPYSEGMQLVYVHAFNDPSIVGTSAANVAVYGSSTQ